LRDPATPRRDFDASQQMKLRTASHETFDILGKPNSSIWTAAGLAVDLSQTETPMQFDKELDARGLNCPLPILRAKKSLNDMQSGQVLKILATDPGSVKDFQAFAKQTGNELLSQAEAEKEFTFFIKRK
jgi:tRNA 2-thiouridine synthesizing protein A